METLSLPDDADALAPDGSAVRALLSVGAGSMAHFELPAGLVSVAVAHRTVEEIWYVVGGVGEMWRLGPDGVESVVRLEVGVCLTITVGTRFQFRSLGDGPLQAVGVTMPPWPGPDEAVVVEGPWAPTAPVPSVE